MATVLLGCAEPEIHLPSYSKTLLDCADLAEIDPIQRAADVVTVLRDQADRAVLGIIVEVQLRWKEDKLFSWPFYQNTLRARLECPVEVVVFCPAPGVARRYCAPIRTDLTSSVMCPKVLGPEQVPVVTDGQQAGEMPELSTLSALTHGDEPGVLEAFACALGNVDRQRGSFYHDYVVSVLSEAARKHWEALMAAGTYEWQTDFARQHIAEGKAEGKVEGKVEGIASTIVRVLEARGIVVTDAVRERILTCRDLELLDAWATRAPTVTTAEELIS